MIFTDEQRQCIYDGLYNWLTVYTPGSRYSKGRLKEYQRSVWNPVLKAMNIIENQSICNDEEQEFLKRTLYKGPIYRIQNYNPRLNGYIGDNGYYQSWSKSINGISNVTNLSDMVLLLVGNAVRGIDIFGLLYFLLSHDNQIKNNQLKSPKNLLRYEKEEEISYQINNNDLISVVAVNREKIIDWDKCGIEIPKDKWMLLL